MQPEAIIHVNGSLHMRGLSHSAIASWLCDLLTREGRSTGEVSVTFVDTATMTDLNERYTGRSGTTDVLAFSQQEGENPAPDPDLLGDVVVDVQRVRAQARHYEVSPRGEMLRVVAHGVLHLLGYDHHTPREETSMRQAEQRYVRLFGRRHDS